MFIIYFLKKKKRYFKREEGGRKDRRRESASGQTKLPNPRSITAGAGMHKEYFWSPEPLQETMAQVSDADNDQFRQAALKLGFCTAKQIEQCLKIQSSTNERLSLGQSLLREGFISDAQYSKILETQRKDARREPSAPAAGESPSTDSRAPRDQEDDLLGKLAVREGWITEDEVRSCLRARKAGAASRSLVEVLVDQGYLDAEGAKELQARLSRKLMSCSTCTVSFTVLSLARSAVVPCPRCRRPLAEGVLASYRRAVDPHATQTFMKALSAAVKPPKGPPGASPGDR
jgi:hypothetical protein